jgi:UDP-2,3-diacylglucosamine pyrophosphatase LpxH
VKLFKRAAKLDQSEYDEKVAAGLDRAFAAAATRDVQVSQLRLVILSDLHRGARDGADDFQRCEPAYSAALGWYLERGYQLYLLGDVEELWENDIGEVLPRYAACAQLERAFMDGPGLTRFFGNHDIDWRDAGKVKKHLDPLLPGIEVLEALKLRVLDGDAQLGLLFLVHGHQGTDLSDRGSGLSRLVLRWVWRQIQNRLGWLSTTPASDYDLRAKHDIAMFRWSRRQALAAPADQRAAMIAGHTHHPVFPDHPPPVPGAGDARALQARLEEARGRGAGADELAPLHAELERLLAIGRRAPYTPPPIDPPTYFNTGCCCFPDRDVTGLEIADGKVTLVRWLDDDGEARPKQLAPPIALADLFARLRAGEPPRTDA